MSQKLVSSLSCARFANILMAKSGSILGGGLGKWDISHCLSDSYRVERMMVFTIYPSTKVCKEHLEIARVYLPLLTSRRYSCRGLLTQGIFEN